MTASIIIPTIHANPELLEECITGIRATVPDNTELIVVDQGLSFGEHCNAGAAEATGDILIFLNDDCFPLPGWYPALLAPFADWHIGITGARLQYPDGRIQHAGVDLTIINGILTAVNYQDSRPSQETSAVTGACLAIRRWLFENLNGFHTGFINGYEDVDLCLRARAAGYIVYYCNDSHLVHHESQSGEARWTHVHSNIQLLQDRWLVQKVPES